MDEQKLETLINGLVETLGLKTQLSRVFLRRLFDQAKLFDNKHQDYGAGNIAAYGELGIVVRMSDKFERLKNLKGKSKRACEAITDTYMDIANHAIIALMVRGHQWK